MFFITIFLIYIYLKRYYSICDNSWSYDRINQENLPLDQYYFNDEIHDYYGDDVDVYVLDTGVNINHPSFSKTPIKLNLFNNMQNGDDLDGHGTFVMSIINKISKNTNIYSVRIHNCGTSYCSASEAHTNIIYALNYIKNLNPTNKFVINLSQLINTEIKNKLNELINIGGIVVLGAGNDNQNQCLAPKFAELNKDASYIVGSINTNDYMSYFSNYGSCVNIYAPGENILAANYLNNDCNYWSGTSFAAPHISGALSYLWSNNNDKTNIEIKNLLDSKSLNDKINFDNNIVTRTITIKKSGGSFILNYNQEIFNFPNNWKVVFYNRERTDEIIKIRTNDPNFEDQIIGPRQSYTYNLLDSSLTQITFYLYQVINGNNVYLSNYVIVNVDNSVYENKILYIGGDDQSSVTPSPTITTTHSPIIVEYTNVVPYSENCNLIQNDKLCAVFGYENLSGGRYSIDYGYNNKFAHIDNAGQPKLFENGEYRNHFCVEFPDGINTLSWTLRSPEVNTVTGSSSNPMCVTETPSPTTTSPPVTTTTPSPTVNPTTPTTTTSPPVTTITPSPTVNPTISPTSTTTSSPLVNTTTPSPTVNPTISPTSTTTSSPPVNTTTPSPTVNPTISPTSTTTPSPTTTSPPVTTTTPSPTVNPTTSPTSTITPSPTTTTSPPVTTTTPSPNVNPTISPTPSPTPEKLPFNKEILIILDITLPISIFLSFICYGIIIFYI